MSSERPAKFAGGRLIAIGVACGCAGIAAFIAGMFIDRRQTMFSYLTAYTFVASTAVGGLVFLAIIHVMRAGWPVAFRRLFEAITAVFPLLIVLFIPIALELGTLYEWLHVDRLPDPSLRQLVENKLAYLNIPFFIIRTASYLVLWVVVAELFRRWSLAQDEDPRFDAARRCQALGAGTLFLLVLTATFAAFDWIVSLAPAWSSAVFGLYWLAGGLVAALSVAILCVGSADARGLLKGVSTSHYYALGRCLFVAVLIWAWLAFFQFFIIWIGDKPAEAVWYVARAAPGWRLATVAIVIVGHFIVPFVTLLPYEAKRSRGWLIFASAWLLVFHYFDELWCIAPALHPSHFAFSWLDALLALGIGGFAVACAAFRLRGHPIAPWNDPLYRRALEYQSR